MITLGRRITAGALAGVDRCEDAFQNHAFPLDQQHGTAD